MLTSAGLPGLPWLAPRIFFSAWRTRRARTLTFPRFSSEFSSELNTQLGGQQLDLILASPYLRTEQTARILAKGFKLKEEQVVLSDQLAPAGHPEHLIAEINEKYGELQHLVIVGHEPYLVSLVSVLISGDPNTSILLKPRSTGTGSTGGRT